MQEVIFLARCLVYRLLDKSCSIMLVRLLRLQSLSSYITENTLCLQYKYLYHKYMYVDLHVNACYFCLILTKHLFY